MGSTLKIEGTSEKEHLGCGRGRRKRKRNPNVLRIVEGISAVEERGDLCYIGQEFVSQLKKEEGNYSMSGKELWEVFMRENNFAECEYEMWAFGVNADLLADLVATGEKTATASAYPLYELENEPLPATGAYNVILDSKDNAVCIIQTRKVTVVPFNEVSAEHAYKEGEGDKSLNFWREVHEKFFTECLKQAGLTFTPTMKVVCEEFEVVYKQ